MICLKGTSVMKKKSIFGKAALFSALLLFSVFAGSCGRQADTVKIVLDWTPNTNHTGLYVAQKLGYFADEGLKVEIIEDMETGALPLMAGGGAQFGITTQEELGLALSADAPLPVTAVAAVLQHNTSGLVSLKSRGIDSFKKLEGKRYATWDAPIEKATIRQVMERQGGDFSKLTLINSTVTNVLAALQSGDIDLVWIYYGWDGVAAEVNNLEINYLPFIEADPVLDFYTPVIAARNEYLQKHPEQAKKFIKAVSKGYEYAIRNPEKAAQILCEYAPEIDLKLAKASQAYLADQYKAEAPRWGVIDKERWEAFYQWVSEHVQPISEKAMKGFTNEYLPD